MDLIFWFNVLTRWLHVTSAVVSVGAFLFLWLVLLPSVAASGSLEPMVPRLKSVIHAALGLLLLTGFYNYYSVIPKVRTLAYRSLYHPIIGTKILLALILFGVATAFLSSLSASGNIGEGRSRSLTVIVFLALVILLLSAFLRRLWV